VPTASTETDKAWERNAEYEKRLAATQRKIDNQLEQKAGEYLVELQRYHVHGQQGMVAPTPPPAIEVNTEKLRLAIAKGETVPDEELIEVQDYNISAERAIELVWGDEPDKPQGVGGFYTPQPPPAEGGEGINPTPPDGGSGGEGGGETVAVTLYPTSHSTPATGGSGSFSVSMSGSGSWMVDPEASATWLTLSQPSAHTPQTANGQVVYSASANEGTTERAGHFYVNGKTFTVNQAGTGAARSGNRTSK
jgi:hypothetical protein